MNLKVVKILASGCYKRFMWVQFPTGSVRCLRISDELYFELKQFGVPTSQSLRGKK